MNQALKQPIKQFERPFESRKRLPPEISVVLLGAGALVGAGALIFYFNQEKVKYTNRNRLMLISKELEQELSDKAFKKLYSQYKNNILPQDHPYSVFVENIAQKLLVEDDDPTQWQTFVVDHPQKNAFVLANKKIFVFTGILPIVENKDGMACVLGHEIGHQKARHSAEQIGWRFIFILSRAVLNLVFDIHLFDNNILTEFGLFRPFSRKLETEADYIGLILMSKACYDPNAAIRVWQRMTESNTGNHMEFLSTHPSSSSRIENFKKWMPEALAIREETCNNNNYFAFREALFKDKF
jgi:predicted Zn-dependent protease